MAIRTALVWLAFDLPNANWVRTPASAVVGNAAMTLRYRTLVTHTRAKREEPLSLRWQVGRIGSKVVRGLDRVGVTPQSCLLSGWRHGFDRQLSRIAAGTTVTFHETCEIMIFTMISRFFFVR
jgi:hypothetical protein